MWELYDSVPETLAEKLMFYCGISAVTIVAIIACVIASGVL